MGVGLLNCESSENYTLFNKYFSGSISEEKMSSFFSFIDELSGYIDKGKKRLDYELVWKNYSDIIKLIGKENFQALIFYYIYDYDYDSRRIYKYGQVKNPENIGRIMISITQIADFLKRKEGF